MQFSPYLVYNGQCETAFKFYEQCFGGKIIMMMTYAGAPMEAPVPPDWVNKIIHARLTVGDNVLMGCDAPPDRYKAPAGIQVSIQISEPEEADRIFNALAENGTIDMPIQQTFWARRFGMLVDRFGIPWMINCENQPPA